jgi:hypothetical protein
MGSPRHRAGLCRLQRLPAGIVMRKSKQLACLSVWLMSLASPLYAHAPYEHLRATVTSPDGRLLQVVACYTDGILGADPVVVVARDASGTVAATSAEARDAIVRCPSYNSCRVFLYDPPFGVFPKTVLRLGPSGFVPEPSDWEWLLGAVLPIGTHFTELLIESVALGIIPVGAQLLARRRKTRLVVAVSVIFGVAACVWVAFWVFGILLNTTVSIAWLSCGVAAFAVIPPAARRLPRRGQTTR